MSDTWRLLDLGARPASYNMAIDKVIIESRSEELVPNTFRFLQFKPHCALVGYHQSIDLEIEEEYCRHNGIDINRRITGGGAIYLDESQLGWEIFALKNSPGIPKKMEDLYSLMCESAIVSLKKLGINAKFRPQNDIEVEGRKISGTGGTEFGNAFLYHGSLLIDFDVDTMLACLKLPVEKLSDKDVISFKKRVISVREILGYVPPIEKIKDALIYGFQETLEISLEADSLIREEEARLEKYLPMFESDNWIYSKRHLEENVDLSTVDYKASGGLIRVSLRLDINREVIKTVFITGDFFAYPSRIILDLEAHLKNSSPLADDLRKNMFGFFEQHHATIPGVTPEDFVQAVLAAIAQAERQTDI
ncbi:MAG TPA: biotin/lipoate A/B protein ligase family protein [Syntrophomonadaceae bacterium]|nr:biotin/lipoate A/B protein ligase family protein [Syntrophomonadaceae bacterium]